LTSALRNLPAERPRERRKGFEALFSNGAVSAEREAGGYDLFDFAPTEYPDFKLPGDYQGTSGGAVWRIYLKLKGEKPEIGATRLWGVPHYQSKKEDGRHVLTCHGMGGVYGALLDAIAAKWPEETAARVTRPARRARQTGAGLRTKNLDRQIDLCLDA
jgi:hypothetical protein